MDKCKNKFKVEAYIDSKMSSTPELSLRAEFIIGDPFCKLKIVR